MEKDQGLDFIFDIETKIRKYQRKKGQKKKVKIQNTNNEIDEKVKENEIKRENQNDVQFDQEPEADFRD